MENKSHALAAGVFVLAMLALLIAFAAWLMRDASNTVAYELVTQQTVTGLQEQAPVRYKGVTVGKVASITLDAENHGQVVIRLAVMPAAPVTRTTYATLGFQGVTGLSFIQLDDDGKVADALSKPLSPGPNGGPPRIPFRAGLLGQLSDEAQVLITQLNTTAGNINRLLAGSDGVTLASTLADISQAVKSISGMAATIQASAGPLAAQAAAALKTLDGALHKLDGTVDDIQQGVRRVTGPGGVLERVGQSADSVTTTTLPHVRRLAEDGSRAMRQLDRAANTLSENPQALLYGNAPIPPGPGEPGYVEPPQSASHH